MSKVIQITFKVSEDGLLKVTLEGPETDPNDGTTTVENNDFVQWHIPENSNIVGACLGFEGKSPFADGLMHLEWDQVSFYMLGQPLCVLGATAGQTFDYDYCVTIKTNSRQPWDQVSPVGKGTLKIAGGLD